MEEFFEYNRRLGIYVPSIEKEWQNYDSSVQTEILYKWEQIKGTIPDRIAELEKTITQKQEQLNDEGDFEKSCTLNYQIAELASIINDLWLWFRSDQELSAKMHT